MTRLPRRRLLWIGAGAATAAGIAVVLALVVFAGDGGGGAAPAVSGSPTAQASPTAPSSPTAQPSPTAADTGPPPVAGEPRYTDSGLGIIDIEAGTGEPPKQGQTVVFHGTLWISNGPRVSSSRDKGKPYKFAVGANPPQAIAGLEEGLASMKVGGKRRLIIPPELGFGGSGPSGSLVAVTLIYDVELVEIK